MRLSLRKRLKPFTTLTELAEALDLTLPELKRKMRELESEHDWKLNAISKDAAAPEFEEHTYQLFHENGRCLVCGEEMRAPSAKRDIGWGEFKQCPKCNYSVHELANYTTRKEAAAELLKTMVEQARRANVVLQARSENSRQLA